MNTGNLMAKLVRTYKTDFGHCLVYQCPTPAYALYFIHRLYKSRKNPLGARQTHSIAGILPGRQTGSVFVEVNKVKP